MVKHQRDQREKLKAQQKERWQKEELNRAARIRPGFKGLWDKLTGSYWKSRKKNEREAWYTYKRDHKESEELFRDLSHTESITTPEESKSQEADRQTYPDDHLEIVTDDDRDLEPHEQAPAKGNKDKGFER